MTGLLESRRRGLLDRDRRREEELCGLLERDGDLDLEYRLLRLRSRERDL